MPIYKALSASPVIPWRLRHGLERWLESSCREERPALYRWLHFGEARDRLRAVTSGPAHHFFGYYEKSPWNASQGLLLAHEAPFNDRPPGPEDGVSVGVVHLAKGNRYESLATSLAWNWQQGSMLQWHPADPEILLLHNDRRLGRFVAVVRDTQGRALNVYDQPIYAASPDGRYAYSVNFARLHTHRPGYGYAGLPTHGPTTRIRARMAFIAWIWHPAARELILSLDELAHLDADDAMARRVPMDQPRPGFPGRLSHRVLPHPARR